MGKSYTKKVAHFGDLMLHRLRANTHKGSWSYCDEEYLLRRLQEEVHELVEAVKERLPCYRTEAHHSDIEHEAADVANFAMMIAEITQPWEAEHRLTLPSKGVAGDGGEGEG